MTSSGHMPVAGTGLSYRKQTPTSAYSAYAVFRDAECDADAQYQTAEIKATSSDHLFHQPLMLVTSTSLPRA